MLIMQVVLQDYQLSRFLYVAATKVVTHFNDNDKRWKMYRPETQKLK